MSDFKYNLNITIIYDSANEMKLEVILSVVPARDVHSLSRELKIVSFKMPSCSKADADRNY